MTYLFQHIAFYALLSAPIWGPLYLLWVFGGFLGWIKATLEPKAPKIPDTPEQIVLRHKRTKEEIARFAAMRAEAALKPEDKSFFGGGGQPLPNDWLPKGRKA